MRTLTFLAASLTLALIPFTAFAGNGTLGDENYELEAKTVDYTWPGSDTIKGSVKALGKSTPPEELSPVKVFRPRVEGDKGKPHIFNHKEYTLLGEGTFDSKGGFEVKISEEADGVPDMQFYIQTGYIDGDIDLS